MMNARLYLLAAALTWLLGCSDKNAVTPQLLPTNDGVLSDAISAQVGSCPSAAAARSNGVVTEAELAYTSLRPGTVPTGTAAVVRNASSLATVSSALINGGFDPVPVAALPGDTIELAVRNAVGTVVFDAAMVVPSKRRPVVVRTDPPPKKRDVPLNSNVVVVFSEPVDPSSLNAGVRLLRASSSVAGTVRLLEGSATTVVFKPAADLAASAEYQLVVTQDVRDLDGDALLADTTVVFTTGTTIVGSATAVTVFPDTASVAVCSQLQVVATARDTNGTPIVGQPMTWSSDDPSVAAVSPTGLVTGVAAGLARVSAEVGGLRGSTVIVVSPTSAPVHSIELTPDSATVLPLGIVMLTAVLRDAAGNQLLFRPVTWHSSAPNVASVGEAAGYSTALVTGVSEGSATITATSEGKSAIARIRIGKVGPYAWVAVGSLTCALSTDAQAWCWGGGPGGNGTQFSTPVPSAVAGGHEFSYVGPGGGGHACGLTPSGEAYCWGSNHSGQLGTDGPTQWPEGERLIPVPVTGGHRFRTLSVMSLGEGVCGIDADSAAYCWGWNRNGVLGIGNDTGPEICDYVWNPCSKVPAAVVGGHRFASIHTGYLHTCALTSTGAAYCWGWNHSGVLGDGSQFDRFAPTAVGGGHSFVELTLGMLHTCGLTAGGLVYCWGSNEKGQLGAGSTSGPETCDNPQDPNRGTNAPCSPLPVLITGNIQFASISAGAYHTCALRPSGVAYCWGENNYGELGNGGEGGVTPAPVPVIGGLTFAVLAAGTYYTCGVTLGNVAYCWGDNGSGQLGTGTHENSLRPAIVAGQP